MTLCRYNCRTNPRTSRLPRRTRRPGARCPPSRLRPPLARRPLRRLRHRTRHRHCTYTPAPNASPGSATTSRPYGPLRRAARTLQRWQSPPPRRRAHPGGGATVMTGPAATAVHGRVACQELGHRKHCDDPPAGDASSTPRTTTTSAAKIPRPRYSSSYRARTRGVPKSTISPTSAPARPARRRTCLTT
jgi:hypothetical protein